MTPVPFIALLRGINVGGRNPVPMAGLRSLCEGLGWRDVRTYIQSGNVVFRAPVPGDRAAADLERGLRDRFGVAVPVIVRPAADWAAYVAGNPFPAASGSEPNLVMLALSREPPAPDALDRLRERAAGGEQVARAGDALWIHFAGGAARTRLTPALLDRAAGSPVTTRNWRTVLRLGGMV